MLLKELMNLGFDRAVCVDAMQRTWQENGQPPDLETCVDFIFGSAAASG